MAATPYKSSIPVSTVDQPGRAPIVVHDPVKADSAAQDATSVFDKVEPGRDVFAGDEPKNLESKPPVEPVHPDEEPKQISSVFQTEVPGVPKKQPEKVLLPDENAATSAASPEASSSATSSTTASTSASSTSSLSSPSSPIHSSNGKFETEQSTTASSEVATSSTSEQNPAAEKPAGPLDHAEAEAERVRQELFPEAAAEGGEKNA